MNTGFLKQIQPDWTLFLDRDGVINLRPPDDYVKNVDEVIFSPGALQAIRMFAQIFTRIIVVTHQQGIGKGLMTEDDLQAVHRHMGLKISLAGGRIDKFYHCPDLAGAPGNGRKPNLVMANWAKNDFPEIDLSKSIMVGDTQSDIEFGRNAGMFTILLGNEPSPIDPDARFDNLLHFAQAITNTKP
jgi:histidinol-phosphate phosphatase family protein